VQSALADAETDKESHVEDVTLLFARFQYRDAVAQVHEAVLAALPGPVNNSSQKALYASFAAGDTEAVKSVPRRERKQLFVTSMAVSFAEDLTTAVFGQMNMAEEEMGMSEEDMEYEAQMRAMEMEYGGYEEEGTDAPPTVPGFLVTVEGYSPYRDIGSLLDPSGVEGKENKWGFVTRLQHMDGGDPNNARFSLYQKGVILHFQLDKGTVDPSVTDAKMPRGIGEAQVDEAARNLGYSQPGQRVLVDPMTQEVITPVDRLDDKGKLWKSRRGEGGKVPNDSWFSLKFKLAWNEAPVVESAPVSFY